MAKVYVSIKNQSGNFEAQFLKELQTVGARDIENLARVHETVIQKAIAEKCEKTTGELMNSWFAEKMNIPGRIAWGVGDINYLNQNVPHWRHVNYGSIVIGANWQHLLPKGRWVEGRWIEDEDGYFAKPQTPLPARAYIEDSLFKMDLQIPSILAENI